ncbi:porin [Gallaecimonas mangrovi]|uniref:porin n=1 Tax=Gallaecimonas mangrovi TaxID=2291597 RepID=UPI000E204DEB|nr:porin [Gallaecimonas mangrovi]
MDKKIKVASLAVALGLSAMSSTSYGATVYKDADNTLDVYGRLQAQIGNGWNRDEDSGAEARMGGRLGFAMSRYLTGLDGTFLEGTKVVGKYEWQTNTEEYDTHSSDGTWTPRYAYLGLSNKKYGDLLIGRTQNPLWQVIKITYKYINWTPDTNSYLLSRVDKSYSFNRQDATVQWNYTNGHNTFEFARVMGNGESDARVDYGNMASYRYDYRNGDFKFSPALAYSDFKASADSIADENEREHRQYMGGFDMYYGDWNLGVTANHQTLTDFDYTKREFNGFDSMLAYSVTNRTTMTLGYSSIREISVTRKKEDWRMELEYRLARKTYLAATYLSDRVNDENSYLLGLRYYF